MQGRRGALQPARGCQSGGARCSGQTKDGEGRASRGADATGRGNRDRREHRRLDSIRLVSVCGVCLSALRRILLHLPILGVHRGTGWSTYVATRCPMNHDALPLYNSQLACVSAWRRMGNRTHGGMYCTSETVNHMHAQPRPPLHSAKREVTWTMLQWHAFRDE
jgi:hypothetical protein